MTRKQALALIRFHRRVERAYKAIGNISNAQQARAHRRALVLDIRAGRIR